MEFTEKDLDNLSALSRITLTEAEKPKMLHDIQAILGLVGEINSIALPEDDTKPDVFNIVREDVVTRKEGEMTSALLENAPETERNYVKVTVVLK